MSNFLRRTLPIALVVLLVAAIAAVFVWRRGAPSASSSSVSPTAPAASAASDTPAAPASGGAAGSGTETPRRGGHLIATLRTEPSTFNRLVSPDHAAKVVASLTQAPLVRVNQVTQQLEPWLAERWETSDDGLRYTLHVRQGLTFSDGTPFTSADIAFTFQALYDSRLGSPLAEGFKIGGKPILVATPDAHTVTLTFAAPYGPGLRLLDSLPILPRHALQRALDAGTFRDAWSTAAPPAEIVGLGPFVLRTYAAGQRVEFERNPRYWRRDAQGTALPYLDRLTLELVPSQSAEVLKFEAGQADLLSGELRPEDIPAMRRLADARRARLHDLGVGLDTDYLWFNLAPTGPASTAAPNAPARPWMAQREFRQAIAHAVDRRQFVDTVLLGAGAPVYGPVTPANRPWAATDLPAIPYDPEKARALLASIGLQDRNQDGVLDAQNGSPVRFSLFTQKGHAIRERAAAVLKEDLKKVGIEADVTPLDLPTLRQRIGAGTYDAIYFGILASDLDPAANLDFWLSRGAFHLWHPSQTTPATTWERQVDGLMQKHMSTQDAAERKRLFDQVQRIFATELPVLTFAAPTIIIATSARVIGAEPALLRPQVLWAADTLAIRP